MVPGEGKFSALLRSIAGRGSIEDDKTEPSISVLVSKGLAKRQSDRTVTLTEAGWRILRDLDADPYLN